MLLILLPDINDKKKLLLLLIRHLADSIGLSPLTKANKTTEKSSCNCHRY
jgi:hypothetical protein